MPETPKRVGAGGAATTEPAISPSKIFGTTLSELHIYSVVQNKTKQD